MLFQLASHCREESTFWPCRGKSQYALCKYDRESFHTLFRQCRFVQPYGLRGLSISRNRSKALLTVCHFPSPAFLHSSVNHEIQQSGETADPSVCGDWPTNLALFSVSLSPSLSSGGWASVCLCVQGFDTAIQALWLPWCRLPYKGNRVKEQWVGCSHSTQTTRNVLPHTRLTPQGMTIGALSMHLRMVKTS